MKYQSSNSKKVYELVFNDKSRYICPECSHTRKKSKQKDLQYYKTDNRAYCFHCDTTFFKYSKYEKKEYAAPKWLNKTELTDKAVKWFTSRMISQDILSKMKLYSDTEFMPQFKKKIEVICFPYFIEEKLINIKYRGAQKTFKLYPNAELIWYNYNALLNNEEIIIVEGEIDLLTWLENGYNNVVSVPNGANKAFSYLDKSIELFDNIKKIYIAVDNDSKGIELRDELIRRIGVDKCLIVNYRQHKDANQFFINEGGIAFKELLKDAKEVPVKGAININTIYNDIVELYKNGIEKGKVIDNNEFDKYVTWELGRFGVCTGNPGSGKSELIDYIVSKLNYIHGWKAAYFTPENYPLKFHYAKIHEKISGRKFKKDEFDDFDTVYEYIKDNFFYILDEDDMSISKILDITKSFIRKYGIKILVIDPYNVIEHQIPNNMTETQYINDFLGKLIIFTRLNNILTFLVAHPRKMQKGDIPSLYDISGSAHFYNKCDYGFTVHRVRDEYNLMTNEIEIHWQKIKFKHLGEQGVSKCMYNYNNGRFEEMTSKGINSWDNSNWLFSDNKINIETLNNDKAPF